MEATPMFESVSGKQLLSAALMALMIVIVGAGKTAHAADAAANAGMNAEADGAAIYEHYCTVCHDRGNGHPGTQSLVSLYGKEKAALTDRDNLTPEYVRFMVRNGRGLMPGFRTAEISDEELKMLAAYLAAGPHSAAPAK